MKFVPSILSVSVLSGGPNSVYAEDAFGIDEEIFELGIPILGICYGMQLLTHKLGGKVVPAGEAGVTVSMANQHFVFVPNQNSLQELLKRNVVLMSHTVMQLQKFQKVSILLVTQWDCPFAAMENTRKTSTVSNSTQKFVTPVYGNDILKTFFRYLWCQGDWSMANFVDMQIAQIR